MITKSIVSSSGGWDEAGEYGDIQLYDAVLAIDTRKFKKGDKVKTITFMFSCGICQIWAEKGRKLENGVQKMQIVEEFPIRLVAEIS
jgi:hypothetical protein